MRSKFIFAIALLLGVLVQSLQAQEVVRFPDSSQTLKQRWTWATAQAKNQSRFQKGYWIGYSIRREMEESSTIGSVHIKNDRVCRGPGKSLSELIYGVEIPLEASTSSETTSDRKVMKEVGIFFGFDPKSGALTNIRESTFSLSVDFKGLSLLWLGNADDEQSLVLIEGLYRQASSTKMKEKLISAIGLHGQSSKRWVLLAEILKSNETDEVRKQAAFWLGQIDDPEALQILQQTARSDRAMEVRKQAVFAMSQMHSTAAEEALIELSRNQDDREVCKQAIFWLAQKASERAVARLQETIHEDADTEIKKHAVFALTQLSDEQSVPLLIEIAEKHTSATVRKEAIFWLGQSEDPRAVAALVKFVREE